jgi:hypothetical protein
MASIGDLVQAKSGQMYDKDSSQGKVIVAAQKRAAASAAQSNSFSAGSSALNTADATPILNNIADDVEIIRNSVNQLVVIAEADARGDALGAANVTDGVPDTTMTGDMTGGGMAGGGGDDSVAGGLAGMGGMAGFIGGLGKGLTMWGAAGPGVLVFTGFLALMTAVVYAGAVSFRKSAPEIAEGMEVLSDADVDTDKVIQMGKALAAFGAAMGVSGVGTAVNSLGTLVSGIADGFAGFLGIEGKDPMVLMREFSKHEFTEDEVKQIELNARALTVFSGAMAIEGTTSAVASIVGLIGGVADGLRALIPVEEKDPMKEMVKFASHKITQEQVDQIKLNAAALLGFSTVMATVKAITVVENIADLASGVVNFLGSFFPEGKDPMIEMKKFAGHKFTQVEVDQIILNSKALLAFSSTMGVAKTMGAVAATGDLFTGIATGIGKLFGLDAPDPMLDMKKFAEHKFTQEEVDQIELNANALVNFSKAMALYSASGAASGALDLVGSMAKGITNFFGGTVGIDYEEIKTFAASDIGTLEPKITANALALSTFATAMSTMASDKAGVEWKNIGANILGAIGGFFGGDANANMMKNFDAIDEFTARTLDLVTVENNISAINRFMEFGQSWVGFKGGDFDGVSDFAEGLVRSANGIHTAMYGGTYAKSGINMKIKEGRGLADVDVMDMTNAGMGIAVLRHSLTNNAPLEALKEVSAVMNTADGGVTVVNAPQTTTTSNVKQGDTVISELTVDNVGQMYFQDAMMSSMPSLR